MARRSSAERTRRRRERDDEMKENSFGGWRGEMYLQDGHEGEGVEYECK